MTPKKCSRGSQFPRGFSFIEQIQELLVQTDHLSSFPTNGKQMQENVNMSINKVKVEPVSMWKIALKVHLPTKIACPQHKYLHFPIF